MSSSPFVATSMGAGEVAPPRLPVRASIYIAPDGTVHFGALFAELRPVAAALSPSTSAATVISNPSPTSTLTPPG